MTDEQISALNKHKDLFLAGDYKIRAHIVNTYLSSFKRAHPQGTGRRFPELLFQTVGPLSVKLGCSKSHMSVSSLFPSIFVVKVDL